MTHAISITAALKSKRLFGPLFGQSSWDVWRAVLKAAFAEPMTATELANFKAVAEREPPKRRVKELVCIAGRGAGKDSIASLIAAYVAATFNSTGKLRPGEQAVVMCLAVDRDQAGIVFGYIRALFEGVPTLAAMVVKISADTVELNNGVVIEVHTASHRSVRGRSIICCVFDEVAFWKSENSASPDLEVHGAVSPGLARVPGSMLILISTAHKRSGLLFERWRACYGKDDDDVLVVLGGTRAFNQLFDQEVIDKAITADPALYGAEYLSHWRDDIETFVRREAVEACIVPHRYELPPATGTQYTGFVDPSGGSADAMTLAIGHGEVLDLVREVKAPFNPDEVAAQFCDTLKSYGLNTVVGDRVGGAWLIERFLAHGVRYEAAQKTKSDFYNELLPLLNAGRAELLDCPSLVAQLCSLERITRSGKIDAPKSGHDDIANAVAGCLVLASGSVPSLWSREDFLGTDARPVPPPKAVAAAFAVLTPGLRGDGAVIYAALAHGFGQLFLLDLHRGPLSPKLLTDIATRLIDLSGEMHAQKNAIYTTKALAAQFERLGYFAETIDSLLAESDAMLAVSAAIHVNGGRVKICTEAFAKTETAPLAFLHGTITEGDAMQTATLAGIAAALDEGR